MTKKYIAFTFILCQLIAPVDAFYAQAGEQLRLQEGSTEDLYAAGGQIQQDGEVNGDLFLVGGDIVVEGNVVQDAMRIIRL